MVHVHPCWFGLLGGTVVLYLRPEEPDENLLALEEVVVLVDTFSLSQPIGTKSCMM